MPFAWKCESHSFTFADCPVLNKQFAIGN